MNSFHMKKVPILVQGWNNQKKTFVCPNKKSSAFG